MHVLLLTAVLLLAPQEGLTTSPDAEMCLMCHSDPALTKTAADGALVSMHVDASVFGRSVHAKLACAECHAGKTEVPHPPRELRSARELRVTYGEQCRRCHFSTYTKTLDSVHQAAVARGDRTAPVCVDCHGSHEVQKPGQPRTSISDTCARCHQGVAMAYAKSIHGRALATEAAGDVPVCTDCHRSHDIGGPHQQKWDLARPTCAATVTPTRPDEEVRPLHGRASHLPRGFPRQDGVAAAAPGHRPERPRRRALHRLPRRARHREGRTTRRRRS
jgi:predicted CXXCH cytochrome family protein